jgi:hypothetical protein
MLCQLVCVDRRYQRMNCFNIRDLQGILKRKFFTDLVNTSDNHKTMESVLIKMRHKNNMSNILLYDQSLFYNFDITTTSKSKNYFFNPGKIYSYKELNLNHSPYININNSFFLKNLITFNTLNSLLKDFINFIYVPNLISFTNIFHSFFYCYFSILNTCFLNIKINNPFLFNNNKISSENLNSTYNSSKLNYLSFNEVYSYNFSENSSTWRFNRYSYPLISYDYKTGNYLSI